MTEMDERNSAEQSDDDKEETQVVVAGSLSPAAAGKCGGGSRDKTFYDCDICEFKFASGCCTNIGTKEYPRMRCKPCNNSTKFVDKSLVQQNMQPKQMKSKKPNKYRTLVLRYRVARSDDPPDVAKLSGCRVKKDRYKHLEEYIESVSSEVYVDQGNALCKMTYREFCGYHVSMLLYKQAEADDLWKKATGPGKAQLKNDVGETVVVRMPDYLRKGKRTGKAKTKRKRATKSSASSDDSSGEREWSKKLKMEHGTADNLKELEEMHGEGVIAAFSEVVEQAPLVIKRADGIQSAPSLSKSTLETLDSSSVASSKKTSKSSKKSGTQDDDEVPTNVSTCRQKLKRSAKRFRTQYWANKSSDAKQLKQLVREKFGSEHKEVQQLKALEKCNELDSTLNAIEAMVVESESWNDSNFAGKFEEFRKCQTDLFKKVNDVSSALVSLRAIRISDVRDTAFSARKYGNRVRAVLNKHGSLQDAGFPASAMSWLGSKLGITMDSDDLKPDSSDNLLIIGTDDDVDWSKVMFWSAGNKGSIATSIRKIITLEEAGVEEKIETFKKHFADKDANDKTRIGMLHCISKEEAPLQTTVPEWFKCTGLEQLGLHFACAAATPWIFASQTLGFRGHSDTIPLQLVSNFALGVRGTTLAIVISGHILQDKGSDVEHCLDLLNGKTPADAAKFLNDHAQLVRLDEGCIMFAPIGHVVFYLGIGNDLNYLAHMPTVAPKFFDKLKVTKLVAKMTDDFLETNKNRAPWKKLGKSLQAWVNDHK